MKVKTRLKPMEKEKIQLDISFFSVLKVIGVLLFVYFLFLVRDIIIILAMSFVFSAALEPTIDKLQKKLKLPRWAGVLVIYLFIAAGIYVFVSMVVPIVASQIKTLMANKDIYADKINDFFASWPDPYRDQINQGIRNLPQEIAKLPVNGIYHRVFGIFSGISGLILVLVFSAYTLSLKNGMNQTLSIIVPKDRKDDFSRIFSKITRKLNLWFKGQILLSLSVGTATFLGLWIMHIPYALILALIAAFTELIPIIGPILGAIPAVIVALFISPLMALIVGIFYLFVQQLEGHILVPQIMKRVVGLNPIIIITAMLIGARLFGILGVILAVPVASSVTVVLKEWPKKENKKPKN